MTKQTGGPPPAKTKSRSGRAPASSRDLHENIEPIVYTPRSIPAQAVRLLARKHRLSLDHACVIYELGFAGRKA